MLECGLLRVDGVMMVRNVLEMLKRYINKQRGVAMPASQNMAEPTTQAEAHILILRTELAKLEEKNLNNVDLGQEIREKILDSVIEDFRSNNKLILNLNGGSELEADFLRAAFTGLSSSFNQEAKRQGLSPDADDLNIFDYLELQTIDLQLLWEIERRIKEPISKISEVATAY